MSSFGFSPCLGGLLSGLFSLLYGFGFSSGGRCGNRGGRGSFDSRFFSSSSFGSIYNRLRGLHFRATTATHRWCGCLNRRFFGDDFHFGRFGAATAWRGLRCRLRFVSAHALFALPPSADAGYLIVG